MTFLRLLGDVHGAPNFHRYYALASQAPYSIQLGDFALDYTKLIESDLHWNKHKILGGNHECYPKFLTEVNHALISYGQIKLGQFYPFYVRGARSVDKEILLKIEKETGIKSWYPEEELTAEESVEAIELYRKKKPRLVVSHDCPASISAEIGSADTLRHFGLPGNFVSPTQETLQCMFEEYQPELWLFAHYHSNWTLERNGTGFICVDTLCYVDLDENLNIIRRG